MEELGQVFHRLARVEREDEFDDESPPHDEFSGRASIAQPGVESSTSGRAPIAQPRRESSPSDEGAAGLSCPTTQEPAGIGCSRDMRSSQNATFSTSYAGSRAGITESVRYSLHRTRALWVSV